MNFLQAVGRARPATHIQQALTSRAREMRDQQAFEQEQKMNTEKIEMMSRQNRLQKEQEADMNTLLPWESISLEFEGGSESSMDKFVYDLAKSRGFVDESIGGRGGIKKKHMAELFQTVQSPTVAPKLSRIRIDFWREKLNEAQQVLKEKPNDKKALEALQSSKVGLEQAIYGDQQLKESMKSELEERKVAATEKRAEAAETRANAFEEKMLRDDKKDKGDKYESNKAQMIDDTRSFYSQKGKHLLDPESGGIQQGPSDNPNKYIDEYQKILSEMKKDMNRIQKGELPSWYSGEEGKSTDEEISKILEQNGYAPTPENIKQFKKNNGL